MLSKVGFAMRLGRPYTVDDEQTMDRVIALGVDGVISDDPDKLVTVARRAGLR